MNKSYSKIRHIQESNKKLERRLLTEDTISGDTISGDTTSGVTTTTTTIENFYDWFKKQKTQKAKTKLYISATESATLESIAKQYGVTVDDILKENPGLTNDNLKPGQMLMFQGYDIDM